MDKITAQTLQELCRLEQDLKRCQRRLSRIDRARVPVYFAVPAKAQIGLALLGSALAEMKTFLQESIIS